MRVVAMFMLLLVGLPVVPGITTCVSSTNAQVLRVPGDHATVQAAIDAAVDGDEVLVAPGRWSGCIDFSGKAITVRSERGAEWTSLEGDCGGTVVCMVSGEGPGTVLEGFAITGGMGDLDESGMRVGGGVRVIGGSPVLRRCLVSGNGADLGGAMHLEGGSPTIVDCWFYRNRSGMGSEVECEGSEPRLIRCGFEGDGIAWQDVGVVSIRDDCGRAGACCLRGMCVMTTKDACEDAAGWWRGEDVPCAGGACPPPCLADVTGDGVVNMTDMLRVIDAWGWCEGRDR